MDEPTAQRIEAALRARPDIARQIEASMAGPARTGRPARRAHMDAARARDDA